MGAGRIDLGLLEPGPLHDGRDRGAVRGARQRPAHRRAPQRAVGERPRRCRDASTPPRVITSTSTRTVTDPHQRGSPAGSKITVLAGEAHAASPAGRRRCGSRSPRRTARTPSSSARSGSNPAGGTGTAPAGGLRPHAGRGQPGRRRARRRRSPRGATSTCTVTATNSSFDPTVADLDTALNAKLVVIGATGATVTGPRSPRGPGRHPRAAPSSGVPSVDPGVGPAGYLPLDAVRHRADADRRRAVHQLQRPGVPVQRADLHRRSGSNSNGYLVVGGGTSEDNNCCNLPAGPGRRARPNNVLAPFWTDLDGTGAAGILAGTLTDGVSTWLVVEHRVNVFGTTDTRGASRPGSASTGCRTSATPTTPPTCRATLLDRTSWSAPRTRRVRATWRRLPAHRGPRRHLHRPVARRHPAVHVHRQGRRHRPRHGDHRDADTPRSPG